VDNDELLEFYLSAVGMGFDPHTSYMSPANVDNFSIQMKLKLEGIGAALRWLEGYTVVEQIVPDGAAHKDGRLKLGDKVVGVGQGKDGPIEDVTVLKLTDVVKRIRGPKGTVVRLQVIPKYGRERKIIDITRAEIQLKDREARAGIFDAGRSDGGRPYRMGVIDLDSFYMDMEAARRGDPSFKSATRDVRGILERFNREQVDAVILDLRRNGGGSLPEAISMSGLFVGPGPVVQVKGLDGRAHPYRDEKGDIVWKGPLVVLISKYSASASEIFAGAIQDYRRGLIVGDRSTHGKGTVQSLLDLSETLLDNPFASKLGALKLTIQKFYRPNGDSTQLRGVLSDVELPSMSTHRDVGEGDLENPLAFDQVKPEKFAPFDLVSKPVVDEIRRLSAKRQAASEDFKRLLQRIVRYEEKKKLKRVTLNEKKFLDEWAEINAQREEEKDLEELPESRKAEIKRDFYLNEALAITADYVARWPGRRPAQPAQAAQSAADN
jgi:carboxyl-terminal processing protease